MSQLTLKAFGLVSVNASNPPGPMLFPRDRKDLDFASSALLNALISVVVFALEGTCANDCRDLGLDVLSRCLSSIMRATVLE